MTTTTTITANMSNDLDSKLSPTPAAKDFAAPTMMGGVHGFADFFSSEVFHLVLHNPTTAYRLQKFSQSHYCGENMEFLEKVCAVAVVVVVVVTRRGDRC